MAVSRKYAGLPDLDNAPEIYETPELTDDLSTIQTSTVKTEVSDVSDDENERFNRQHIDTDVARQRFENSIVDARDANFSSTVAPGGRRSYRTRSRRRRARNGNDSAESSDEEESLNMRIARLKKETEEVRLQLARQKEEEHKQESKDSSESPDATDSDDSYGVQELSNIISQLSTRSSVKEVRGDAGYFKQLEKGSKMVQRSGKPTTQTIPVDIKTTSESSTLSAVATFSDRLAALETALGLTAINQDDRPVSILPTIHILSTQINILSTTLMPPNNTRSSTTTTTTPALQNLDALAARIRALTTESDKLTQSRKSALQSMTELHEARLRRASSRHLQSNNSRPGSSHETRPAATEEARLQSSLFLDEQASKINALYQTLPTIQNLQPLLPVVLDRLRALHAIHAGAADARAELEEVQKQQSEMAQEVKKWREAVEGVEEGIDELGGAMGKNLQTLRGMIGGLEERVARLQKGR